MGGRGLAVFALAGLVWLAGCSAQDAHNIGEDTKKLGQDIGPAVGGAALNTKVSAHLVMHKGVDMSGLHIESSGTTVTVSGHVRDAGMHKKVIEALKETTGVDKVVDKLNLQK